MLTIRRILFAFDFSEGSTQAFPQAVFLAQKHGAELHIVHVSADDAEGSFPIATKDLAEWLADDAELDDLPIVQEQRSGSKPGNELRSYVEEEEIDLVVMGTHGSSGTDRLLFGSVAEEVVREVPCPVLTVRSGPEKSIEKEISRVLVPVDFSDVSRGTVSHAAHLAEAYGAELHLFHVIEVPEHPPANMRPENFPEKAVLDQAKYDLEKLASELELKDFEVAAQGGDPSKQTLAHIDSGDIDLVVIASKGRTGLDRMLIGSVADDLLRKCPVPVFTVKPGGRSLLPGEKGAAEAASA